MSPGNGTSEEMEKIHKSRVSFWLLHVPEGSGKQGRDYLGQRSGSKGKADSFLLRQASEQDSLWRETGERETEKFHEYSLPEMLTYPLLHATQCLPKTWEEVVCEMLLSLLTCLPHSHPGTSPGGALPLQAWRCLRSFLDCWLQESWNPDCLQVSLEQARQASWGPQTTGTAPRKERRGPSYLTAQDRLTLTCPRGLRLTSHRVRGKQGKGMLWEVGKVNTTEFTELAEVWI